MKKIRFVDQTELEIYDITCNKETLCIKILNADPAEMEGIFSNSANMAAVQYYVDTDLMQAYAGYTQSVSINKALGVVIAIDYETPDETTESGFSETKADIVTVTLQKKKVEDEVAELKEQVSILTECVLEMSAYVYE